LQHNELLGEGLKELMFTPHESDYGLGWQIVEKNSRIMYNHNGSTHGFNSRMVYYPNEDIFIAILGNNEDVRTPAVMCDIEGLIFNKDQHVLGITKSLSNDQLQKFEGIYRTKSGKERVIRMDNNRIFYVNGESEFELLPLSKHVLCFSGYEDIRLTFANDRHAFIISSCSINPETYSKE